MNTDVLIVGAGPTGLVLALWLTRQGIPVRIIDKDHGPGETSRAMGVQARTLELYNQLDLANKVVKAGYKNSLINLWVKGQCKAHLSFGNAGAEITPFPFLLIFPQDQHEKLLIQKLSDLGIRVERETELIDFEKTDDYVSTHLRLPDGSEENCKVRYLAGCDGARSFVRHKTGISFPGGTYKQIFYVADVKASGLNPPDEVHIALDSSDFVAILPYGKNGQSRLIGTVRDERAECVSQLVFKDVAHEAIDRLKLIIEKVNWFSTYKVHHRVANSFRSGRVFLLGDAAHVHSPAGGQGMNTGIADAINLAWKFAAVLQGKASEELLNSYEIERQAFARQLVDTTDRVFSFISAEGKLAHFLRLYIAPIAANLISRIKYLQKFMFRVISQTTINYRPSPLSKGKAGKVQGGDRLPWVKTALQDNYQSLKNIGWQIHIYGNAPTELRLWCEENGLALHVFPWDAPYQKAGLVQGAAYLLRPDTYIAFVNEHPTLDSFKNYFKSIGFS